MTNGAPTAADPSAIAIVGIALRFPGAHGPEQFWSNLRAGVESLREFTDQELAARGVPPRLLSDPAYVKRGHVLDGLELFDAEFFGFSPKDAAILDPQHRQFLECAWEALEDAGHPPDAFDGPIGVFGGCGMNGYFTFNLLSNPALVESVGMFLLRHTGNDKDFLTTRVSYCLALEGPSVSIQTACSTSLVAIHVACQSLIGGECDMALAGGVTIEIPHALGYLSREGEILSPDGHCRPFDRRAQGTSFGSGVGLVVLRRLEDALRDRDRIYAVVKGSAVDNDGARKVGYLAPSVDGQAAAVVEALANAGVRADEIDYVEAHGSGTPIGDPIEVAAITRAFARSTERHGFCGLGSVKANIGHLDTAAGAASLIKTALCLHHGEIPGMPTFDAVDAKLQLGDTPFYVVDRLRPWPRRARARRACVNSLGVGGTNAHAVLEEAPAPAEHSPPRREWQLLCLSARNERALDEASQRLASHLRGDPAQELADVAFTLLVGRRGFVHRRVLVAKSCDEAAELLESPDPRKVFTRVSSSVPAPVVFLLAGGGTQHPRMGCELYGSEPVFREQVERGLDAFRALTQRDLRSSWICPTDPRAAALELQRPSLQLPAIFILEHALAQLWSSLGVQPSALIGHSLGENTAACLAGIFSFEDALGLVALRGELFEQLPEGGMLSVALPVDEIPAWLGGELDLAAINSPSVSIVSGPAAAVDELARRLAQAGVEASRIPITTAAHSRSIERILPRFLEYLRGIDLHPPTIPLISNSSGTWITAEQATRPEYWAEHLRGTVQFSDGVRTLLSDPQRVFLEVGPGKALASLVRQHPAAAAARDVLSTLRHADEPISDTAHLLTAFGRLWACGVALDREAPWSGERRRRVSVPTYPFQRRRYWIEPGERSKPVAETSQQPRPVELLEEGFARPVWRAVPASPAPVGTNAREWLLFLDAAGVGERLARRLRQRGERVVTVLDSDDNRWLTDERYSLAPERGREGYVELIRQLVAAGRMPQHIVHLWLLTPDESCRPGSNFFHHTQERGFYSLFFLAQAIAAEALDARLHISVISNALHALDGELLLHPGKATVLGPCKVIPREFPGITCSSIDVPLPVSSAGRKRARRSSLLERVVEQLELELSSAPRCAVVAYRGESRFEQEFERIELDPAHGNGHAPIRERGVYLITGGLGGIGLAIAAELARRAHARIVLVGRSPLPERDTWNDWLAQHAHADPTTRRIRAVQELETAGAEVLFVCADVTDVEAMQAAIELTRRRFGALHGVMHAAGVLRDAPIASKTQQQVEEVFAAKVHGTLVLDALLREVDLDFLVLFSSVSAIVAAPGQVDYAAANAFLDAYAHSANAASRRASRAARRRHTVSVDWGIWNGIGMAADVLQTSSGAASARANGRSQRHPLFDSRSDDPNAPLVLHARYERGTRWIHDEHRTRAGRAIVPGSAYLEMARAALIEAGESPTFEMRDLLLLSPLHVGDDAGRDVEIELRPDPAGSVFVARSRSAAPSAGGARDEGERWDVHAQARLVRCAPRAATVAPLAEIEARCSTRRCARPAQALPAKQAHLVSLGPRWQTLREVRTGPCEALATLELDNKFAGDLDHYGLHPALLDIAMTCGLELAESNATAGPVESLWVPLSYKRIRVDAPLPARVRSWVKPRATDRAGAAVLSFDVVVTDGDGRVCVEIEEFVMRGLERELGLDRAATAGAAPVPSSNGHSNGHAVKPRARALSRDRSTLRFNSDHGIVPAQGFEALQRILGVAELAQVVATSLDLEGLRRQAEARGDAPDSAPVGFERPELGSAFSEPRDEIERTLAGFWRELLGVHKVGVRDSFFDLGGHSLIAVRLFARIKQTYQVEFPISLLFEAPTIERCAEAIRRATGDAAQKQRVDIDAPQARYTHLVAMHSGPGGSKTPFFLVAGMFGNVLNLRHLAHLLGDERRFFGLQALGLYGAREPRETFEEMASDYLGELRRIQPHGPYLLGGFSGGGITAYEMAQQLTADGEEVALLAMLDAPLPQSPRLTPSERARIHWDRLRRSGPVYLTRWARERVRWEIAQRRKRTQDAGAEPMPSEFRSEQIAAAFRRALASYRLRPYAGTITLLRPKVEVAHVLGPGRVTNSRREFVFHDNGWGAYAAHVDVLEVAGTHDSMVLEPNVRSLAAKLRKCIQTADSRATRAAVAAGRHFLEVESP